MYRIEHIIIYIKEYFHRSISPLPNGRARAALSPLHYGRGWGWVFLLLLSSCAIKDDIPFPIVEGAITAFEVEGQCDAEGNDGGTAVIDNNARMVNVYVNDLVDISNLRIKRMEVSN